MIWPHLDLMVIRSDHDNPDEVFIGQPSLQDLIDIIRATRESVGLPVAIKQPWVFERLNSVDGILPERHESGDTTRDRLVALTSSHRARQLQGESHASLRFPGIIQDSSRMPWVL